MLGNEYPEKKRLQVQESRRHEGHQAHGKLSYGENNSLSDGNYGTRVRFEDRQT